MTTYRDYTANEIVRQGESVFQRVILPRISRETADRHVVIDIETGDWEIGDDVEILTDRLHARHSDAPLYHRLVGRAYTGRIGGRLTPLAETPAS